VKTDTAHVEVQPGAPGVVGGDVDATHSIQVTDTIPRHATVFGSMTRSAPDNEEKDTAI
jgi:hypothetical protein